MSTTRKTTSTKTEKKLTYLERIDRLEAVIAKLAHYTGQQNVLKEFGLEAWQPGVKDMSKFSDVK